MDLVTGRLEILAQQRGRTAVELPSRHDRRGFRSQGKDREMKRGHARRTAESGLAALEIGDGALQHLAIAVRIAPVIVTGSFAAHYCVVVVKVGVHMDSSRAEVWRERTAGRQLAARVYRARCRLQSLRPEPGAAGVIRGLAELGLDLEQAVV